jgi:hypothetical protein
VTLAASPDHQGFVQTKGDDMPSTNMPSTKTRVRTGLAALFILTASLTAGAAPAHALSVDGTCLGSVTLNFDPPATEPSLFSPAPHAVSTGNGTIAACAVTDGGATTGTFSYRLEGNLTCTTAQNITGTLDIAWTGGATSHATVTGLVTSLGSAGGAAGLSATIASGRFTADTITIANIRDPLALIACLTTGLAQAGGTTSLTFANAA